MGERQAKAYFLGRRRYEPIHALQQQLVSLRADGHIEDLILLVEHEPVVTLGRAADAGNVLFGEELLAERGVDLVQTGRGGDVTYHGPGQLVCYPILDLKPDRCDVRRYVRSLAEVMILIAREYGVESGVVDGYIGLWADRAKPGEWAGAPWASEIVKLGAIGVRLSRWITMHGFALNLSVNLGSFGMIVPCGIRDHSVTSIEELVGRAPAVRDVALGCHALLSRGLELSVARVEDISDVSDLESALLGQARASFGPAEQEKPAAG